MFMLVHVTHVDDGFCEIDADQVVFVRVSKRVYSM